MEIDEFGAAFALEDARLKNLARYTVGLVKWIDGNDGPASFTPSGTGTLFRVNGIPGVLTAAHVVENLKKSPWSAIWLIEPGKIARPFVFRMDECEISSIGTPPFNSYGPDLAFFRIPPKTEEWLLSRGVFFDVDSRLNSTSTEPLDTYVLVGMPKKLYKGPNPKEYNAEQIVIFATGHLAVSPPSDDGYDYFDFCFSDCGDFTCLADYEGVSGGAVWALGPTTGPEDRYIAAVAYYQSDLDTNGRRTIKCHGWNSIYKILARKITS